MTIDENSDLPHPVTMPEPQRFFLGTVPESIALPDTTQAAWDTAQRLYADWEDSRDKFAYLFQYAEQPGSRLIDGVWHTFSRYLFAADADAEKADDALLMDKTATGAADAELAKLGTPHLDKVKTDRRAAFWLLQVRAKAATDAQRHLTDAMRKAQPELIFQATKALAKPEKALERARAALEAAQQDYAAGLAVIDWAENVRQEVTYSQPFEPVSYPPEPEQARPDHFTPLDPRRYVDPDTGRVLERYGM